MALKVAIYTICLNEEKHVQRWYESAKDADYILIADTGSTDRTVEIAKSLGINVVNVSVSPWRFDDARNSALHALPVDVDYCIALDMDEVLLPTWKDALLKAHENKVTRPRYKYTWSWKSEGVPDLQYGGDKIHSRKGYRWRHPVHEVITPYGIEETQDWVDLEIHHHPDNTKSRGQYFPLLKMAIQEDPDDDRNAFYYARELFFHGMNQEAAQEFRRHLSLPRAGWAPERAASHRYMSKCEPERVEEHLNNAISESERREPLVELAMHYYEKSDWNNCYEKAIRALQIKEKPLDYLCEDFAWGYLPHDLASISAWHLGKKDEAIEHEKKALEFEPNDKRMLENFAFLLRDRYPEPVTAIIPTKSNIAGTLKLLEKLETDPQVTEIIVIADGDNSHDRYKDILEGKANVVLEKVQLGVGIHVMWNIGIDYAIKSGNTAVFINDDTVPVGSASGTLASFLEYDKSFGLVCPKYDTRNFKELTVDTTLTAMGRTDGTGGLAGFFMALHKDLVPQWRFDEKMKWWFGDDDVIQWTLSIGKRVSITNIANCYGNDSKTTREDPPKDFAKLVAEDKKIFKEKWPGKGL